MDIYAKKGTKVRFNGCDESQWKYGGHDDPTGLLEVGKEYTVDHTVVHDFNTQVFLEEFPDKDFNVVCFD